MNRIDLWTLLNEKKTCIPIIQRDYAQGREGKESLRKQFLNDIISSLDKDESLNLDFVFGTESDIKGLFLPLDGQQRLTTLWLIYWFLALKKDAPQSDFDILNNFTYETRTSSSDFFDALCKKEHFFGYYKKKNPISISEYIKSQTWFYSTWMYDPTISAVLRMLSGSGDNALKDNIESVFSEINYEEYYKRLKNKVSFNYISLGDGKLPVPDDQYIKMNSRGLGLTSFENFKLNLVSWLRNNTSDQEANRLAANIDNKWTDVIWREKRNRQSDEFDHAIDNELFSFIKRIIINEACLKINKDGTFVEPSEENYEKNKMASKYNKGKISENVYKMLKAFDVLIDNNDENELFADVYEPILSINIVKKIDRIFEKLDDDKKLFSDINVYFNELRIKDTRREWLLSTEYGGILNQVYFYAITTLLSVDLKLSRDTIKHFMRISRNLIESMDVGRSRTNMVMCIRKINYLLDIVQKKHWNINNALANENKFEDGNSLERQWKEECEKALAINKGEVKESDIEDIENYAFFKGAIRFVYRGTIKDLVYSDEIDWSIFAEKKKKCKDMFDDQEDVSIDTIKEFLSSFSNFGELIQTKDGKLSDVFHFSTIGQNWNEWGWREHILLGNNEQWKYKIHCCLSGISNNTTKEVSYEAFLNASNLIEDICKMDKHQDAYIDNCEKQKMLGIRRNAKGGTEFYIAILRGTDYNSSNMQNGRFKRLIDSGVISLRRPDYNTSYLCNKNGIDYVFWWGKKICFSIVDDNNTYGWNDDGKIYSLGKQNVIVKEEDASLNDFLDKRKLP